MKCKHLKHLFTAMLLLCATVATAHDFVVGGIYYNILSEEDKTVEVTCSGTYYSSVADEYTGKVVIPESVVYNDVTYSVTSIGYDGAFAGCTGLTSVEIPNSVTSIGYYSFCDCTGLTSVKIPNSVTVIGGRAFEGCSKLTSVEIPNSVTSIGNYAFYNCSGLTSIEIPSGVKSISERTFCGCSGLTSVTISNSVTSIGTEAFAYCYGLTSIEIPNSVTSIGYMAFYYCTKLPSIVIPNSVTSISSYAFSNCWGLTSITIPNSVTSIGIGVLSTCEALTSIEIPSSVTSIGDFAFCGCDGLKSITIPNSVTSIGTKAFERCSNLTSIEIPNSVTSIGDGVFSSCSGLSSVVIGNSVTSIGDEAFYNCSGLTSVVIGNSVTSIGNYAFYYCDGLKSITIPNSVTSIGDRAFSSCSGLTSVVIGNSVTSIGNDAFYYCDGLKTVVNLSDLTFTKGSSSYGYVAYYADKIINNGFIEGDFVFNRTNGVNTLVAYLGNATELTLPADCEGETYVIGESAFSGCKGLTSITIPNSVTSIGNYAFENCIGLTSIEIPSGVTSIRKRTFSGCSGLTSITIPNSVTSIGNSAFYNCTCLTSIEIPNSVTSIGKDAFLRCNNLTSVELPSSLTTIEEGAFSRTGLIEVTIPEGVTSLGKWAFDNSPALSKVSLPTTLTSIGENAFENCTGLTSITIPNSVTSIGNNAFHGCTALKTVINNSNLDIEKGSTSNGHVAYYAKKVIKFELVDGVYTLVKYESKGAEQEEVITFNSWTSTNKGQSGSTSSYKYTFDATAGSKLSFDWSVSSETNYDKLYVKLDGTTELTKSGEYSGNYEHTFTVTGSHTLEVKYTKDGSGNYNNDEAKIYNVKLTKTFYIPADVVLPDNYEGELYVIGESAFENNEYVASVTIPEGVEMICDKAFSGCSNLENIVIPNSVLAIGGDAFAGTKWYDNKEDGMVYAGNVLYKYKGSMPENTAITINDGTLGVAGLAFANCTGLTSITSLIPADNLFVPGSDAFVGVDKTNCTLYVPYGAKETYASTAGWSEFANIVELEPEEITITINQYGNVTFCSDLALDFSNVEGLKAYAATGYNKVTQVVTLTRLQTAEAGVGLFLKGEPGEYVVPVIEYSNDYSLNMLVGTLEQTTVNSTDGSMSNYKFTIADGDAAPMFYPFEDNTTFSAGKAYLQIPTAWLPATAQKSVSIRFDEGETTDLDEVFDEVEGQNGEVKTIYDLSGRVVENPTSGIYIIDGKKVVVK